MKVNKEEMLGMLMALERFVKMDHALEGREFERRAELIRSTAAAVPGVKAEVFVPRCPTTCPISALVEGGDEAGGGGRGQAMKDGSRHRDPNEKEALVIGVG